MLTRQDLADPFRHIPYKERLIMAGAIDLKDNSIITYKDGYIIIKPIDKTKLVK